ncbi:hypothetical protein O6P43_011180 [Quillaja saponaria]|uniref:Uncharacterized protein n=1 Tax=Quillaja saponaria TaxID=32244 RepID=A0AAD7Q230_QUISA|nr:hypothetical protein O6P43_011180 [Quillaja saponaria]
MALGLAPHLVFNYFSTSVSAWWNIFSFTIDFVKRPLLNEHILGTIGGKQCQQDFTAQSYILRMPKLLWLQSFNQLLHSIQSVELNGKFMLSFLFGRQ